MQKYVAPLRDMQFVMEHWLQAAADWKQMTVFKDLDLPLVNQVLEEAGRFSADVLAPLNNKGDRQGCCFDSGRVATPDGFFAAYRAFVEAGWPTLECAEEFGGQGLPQLLGAAFQEMQYASNHAWAMYSGIAHGAYLCLKAHGPQWIKEHYLPQIVSGDVLPTMCLTEPQAGSDVGLLRCRAEPEENGAYRIIGSKIFISGGEHDLTHNILHLVLARLPGAPAGSRGVSLFLVPKLLDGGQPNNVHCTGIEHKMGIKGSATCSLAFDYALGWMIGEANGGLAAMFVMMNSARLHVGLQGLGHAEAAWQGAFGYALERKQMRSPTRPEGVGLAPADPILFHPAMRRTLLDLKARVEGMRAIGYWVAHLLDQSNHCESGSMQQRAGDLVRLLTPIIKAYFTEQGFRLASHALQVFGGYGYISEYAIEQTLRDSRIAMIYEGSNEIQANDFLLRQVLADDGRAFKILLSVMYDEAEKGKKVFGDEQFAAELEGLCAKVELLLFEIFSTTDEDSEYPYRAAGDFLRLCGVTLLTFAWARSARVSQRLSKDDSLRTDKIETARFFFSYLLPEADHYIAGVRAARAALPFLSN